jgi:pyruvate/2-oxoglutarate dehydrogenase complex dihydrolipoamide dehydrogenase (E3) component
VTGVALFTHVGTRRVAARHMLGDANARADYRALPRVTFCDPQVAGAGMTRTRPWRRASSSRLGADISGVE